MKAFQSKSQVSQRVNKDRKRFVPSQYGMTKIGGNMFVPDVSIEVGLAIRSDLKSRDEECSSADNRPS